ncbi:MAG: DUF177 domain-containing protein [Lachnospiraceae bacterium]|nr:DUF177 domain-containing protein [Lachnospiraceae bacterium]
MLVNLSDALTLEGKTLQLEVQIEADRFEGLYGGADIIGKTPLSLTAVNIGAGEAKVEGHLCLTFTAQCDRCLAEAPVTLEISFERTAAAPDAEAEADSRQFMEGYQLDVDALVQNEILLNWPVKILCKEDCRGICPKCGQNLNGGMRL